MTSTGLEDVWLHNLSWAFVCTDDKRYSSRVFCYGFLNHIFVIYVAAVLSHASPYSANFDCLENQASQLDQQLLKVIQLPNMIGMAWQVFALLYFWSFSNSKATFMLIFITCICMNVLQYFCFLISLLMSIQHMIKKF